MARVARVIHPEVIDSFKRKILDRKYMVLAVERLAMRLVEKLLERSAPDRSR